MSKATPQDVLARIFEHLDAHLEHKPEGELSAETEIIKDLNLDSMQSGEMVAELEDHYDVTIPLSKLQEVRTLGDVATAVAGLL